MAEKYTPKRIITAIKKAKGNITATSKILKCTPATVRRYIKKYPAVKKAADSFPKTKASGKEKYTQKQVIKAIEESRGVLAVAARKLECTRTTVYSYKDKYPAIKAAYEDINETTKDQVENQLLAHIFGVKDNAGNYVIAPNLTAAIFYAKTKMKDRGYVERVQVEKSIDLDKLTVEQLKRLSDGEDLLKVLAG